MLIKLPTSFSPTTRLRIAFFASHTLRPLDEIANIFLQRNRPEFRGIPDDYVVPEILSEKRFEPACVIDNLHIMKDCDMANVEDFKKLLPDITDQLLTVSSVCYMLKNTTDDERRNRMEGRERIVNMTLTHVEKYQSKLKNESFYRCAPVHIDEFIKSADSTDLQSMRRLGDRVLQELVKNGDHHHKYHVVVFPKKLEVPSGISISCKGWKDCRLNSGRNVSVFYSRYIPNRKIVSKQETFWNSTIKTIKAIFSEKQNVRSLSEIRDTLEAGNASLSGEHRFQTELILHSSSAIGDCLLHSYFTTNADKKSYSFLRRKYRNEGSLRPCQVFEIYVFP